MWVLCGCGIISSPCLRGRERPWKDTAATSTSLQGCDGVQTGFDIQCVLGELPNVCISAWLLLVGVNASFQAWFPPTPEFFAVLRGFFPSSLFPFFLSPFRALVRTQLKSWEPRGNLSITHDPIRSHGNKHLNLKLD